MLYIIGIHHMQSFVRPGTVIDVLANRGTPVLCTFTAISAYFMGRKTIETGADAAAFYKRRLARIYPLYLLGCLTLFIASRFAGNYIQSVRQLLLTLAGLSMLIGPAPRTMWYMSMLMLFWALTPLFLYRRRRTPGSLAVRIGGLAAWLAILAGLARMGLKVDGRLYPYSLIYFGILIVADRIKLDDKPRLLPALAAAAVMALFALGPVRRVIPGSLCQLAGGCAGIVLMLTLGQLCALWRPLAMALGAVSYASMAAYLFHRQWLGLCFYALGPFSLPGAAVLMLALLAGCYGVQWFYDRRIAPRFAR